MSLSILKKAANFTWNELKSRPGSWIMLTVAANAMVFGLMGVISIVGIMSAMLLQHEFVDQILSSTVSFSQKYFISISDVDVTPYFEVFKNYTITGWYKALFLICVIALVYYLIYQAASYSMVIARNVLDVIEGKKMRWFKQRIASHTLLWVGISYTIAMLLGLVCLIIPGLIVMVRFCFANIVVLDKQCGIKDAFVKSWNTTKGYFFVLFVAIMLISILFYIPYVKWIFYFVPLNSLFIVSLYCQLKKLSHDKLGSNNCDTCHKNVETK